MADRDSERDRRVRSLLSGNKDNMAVMSQAQAEIGDIQSELRNTLDMAQAQDQARLRQSQTISQAAQGMMAMDQGSQVQGQVAAMNPQTQATMGKFGIKPGTQQNSSSNNSSSRVVTKSGDITNVKNENITNNHTEIRVTQPTIPISQPNIPVQTVKQDNTAKFKAWLSEMFAKQENEAEIQRKEYRKKEWNLGRLTSRLMTRIEDAAVGISTRLDPRNVTGSLSGQLKWLLMIFGATMVSKVWKPTMKFLANLEYGFRAVFGLPVNEDLKNSATTAVSMVDQIKGFIGIKRGENDTLINGIGKVFMQGIDKLIDKLKFWFEDRSKAVSSVEFPKIDLPDFGGLGSVLSPIMEGFTDTFKGLTQYLGDLITVAMGGSAGKVKTISRRISRQAQSVYTDTTGKNTSAGDTALMRGSGRDYMRDSDYDMLGNLKSNASSTQAMSRSIISLFNDKSNKAHTAELGAGIEQLFNVADRQGKVVIDPELLQYLGLTPNDIYGLKRSKNLYPEKYRIIQVRPNTKSEMEDAGAYMGKDGFWTGGSIGTAAGIGIGIATGNPLIGAAAALGGGAIGSVTGDWIDNKFRRNREDYLIPKLVPADSYEKSVDGSLGMPKTMWVLTKKGADEVTARFTYKMTSNKMDNTNSQFYEKLRKIEESRKRLNGVQGALTQNTNVNSLRSAQSEYEYSQKRYYDNFESNDPNSINMKKYGNWNTFSDNFSNITSYIGGKAVSWTTASLRNGANYVRQERLTPKDMQDRAMYAMHRLIQEGLTPDQAAGVVGNLYQESRFVTNAKRQDRGQWSGGIAQWYGPRLAAIERYFGKKIEEIPFEDQLEYFIKEIKGELNDPHALGRISGSLRKVMGGFSANTTVFDALKRAGSAAEAAVIQERGFEVSADWSNNRDKNRIAFANGYLDLYKQNPNAGQGYQSKTLPNINLEALKDESVKTGQKLGAGWLGDSQSCVAGGLFPLTVGSGLGTSFSFYARGSANATHYLGTGNTKNLSAPSTNIQGYNSKSCSDALEFMLQNQPKYCFIALGHNGMSGYQNLVNKLRGSGIKVICIKMWSTQAASGTGMRSYSKDEMSAMYKNISADGMVDLTQIDIPKSSDGVHASKSGCLIAAREVIQQLSGAAATVGSEEGMGDIKSGLFGQYSDTVAGLIDKAADIIDPSKNGASINPDPFAKLTKEQKKIVDAEISRQQRVTDLNVKSWETMGAKTDERGTYFESNGTRVYVRTDGSHNGYLGLRHDDIDWVESTDASGKPTKTQPTDQEAKIAADAIIMDSNRFFNDYPEKNGSNDYVKNNQGKPVFYNLGNFTDIDNFSEYAKKDFGGDITFLIAPSMDLKAWTMVKIPRKVGCSKPFIYWDEDWNIKHSGAQNYGEIIYHKGAHWKSYRSDFVNKKYIYTDIQPVCEIHKVGLTPKAVEKAKKVLVFLNKVGEFSGSGQLSKEEQELAIDAGILLETRHAGTSGNTYSSEYRVNDTYTSLAQAAGKMKLPSDKKFSVAKYSQQLNIGTEIKDRKDYYEKNKKDFTIIDSKIYGPGGVMWGIITNSGKPMFFDNASLEVISTEENLRWNNEAVDLHASDELAKGVGVISRERMAKYVFDSYKETQKGEIQGTLHGGKQITTGVKGQYTFSVDELSYTVPYQMFVRSNGTVYKVKTTAQELRQSLFGDDMSFQRYSNGDVIETTFEGWKSKILGIIHRIHSSNEVSTREKILKEEQRTASGQVDLRGLRDLSKSFLSNETLPGLTPELIKKGKKILTTKETGEIEFEDRSVMTVPGVNPQNYSELKKWAASVNAAIETKQQQIVGEARLKAFKSSGLDKVYAQYAEDANTGKMTVDWKEGAGGMMYAYTTGGDIFGYKDKDGKVKALGANDKDVGIIDKATFDYFNQSYAKAGILSNILGLKREGGKYFYERDGKRVAIDMSKDLNTIRTAGMAGMTTGKIQVLSNNGTWSDTTDEETHKLLGDLMTPLEKMVKTGGLTQALIAEFQKKFSADAQTAARARREQINKVADQKKAQDLSNEYLETIAKKGLNDEDLKKLQDRVSKIENENHSIKNWSAWADDIKASGKDLQNYEVYSQGSTKVVIDKTQFAAKKDKKFRADFDFRAADTNNDGVIDEDERKAANIESSNFKRASIYGRDQDNKNVSIIYSKAGDVIYVNPVNGNYEFLKDTNTTLNSSEYQSNQNN